ncbi:MAG: hypothetical protein A2Y77_15180 [Planctomycetes bacterium RBG_13_62_9]|nr:MAG: hypothetical protein A2Y77_15180 [Planctomycetes bacterium RBG_13_62_9]
MEAGFEKLLCTLRMANHFLAQESPWDYNDGMGMASDVLRRLGQLVITEDVPQEWLAKLEAVLPSVEDTWDEKGRQLAEVSSLHEREIRRSLPQRLVMMFTRGSSSKAMKRFYLLHVAECRGGRILLALRRHKDRTGAWPADLAAIKPYVSSETIIDPFSGKPFVYRVTGNTFLLYSVGPGGTDDGGIPPRDRVLWPR